ncbi:MAG TPA: PqiC family protein [Bordetella sp.]
MSNRIMIKAETTRGMARRLPPSGRPAHRLFALASAAALAALAGCAGSPQVRYYTLTTPVSVETAQAPAAVADYAIEVMPVSVPAQVDQPQLMLRSGSGELTAQYSDRWSAPLPDELRNALSDTLTRQLGAPDVHQLAPAASLPVWRVQVDVQRFDASTTGPAVIDATWRVRPVQGEGGAMLCRNRVEVPVAPGPGLDAVIVAEQQAVALLGRTIASAVQSQGRQAVAASDQVQAPRCTR